MHLPHPSSADVNHPGLGHARVYRIAQLLEAGKLRALGWPPNVGRRAVIARADFAILALGDMRGVRAAPCVTSAGKRNYLRGSRQRTGWLTR